MLLCQVTPFMVPFRLYSSFHISSLTQSICILWSGCWLTRSKIQCAQKRLYSSYLSWHIFESYTTGHNKKDFCSCLKEFQGSGQRTLKILGQAQWWFFFFWCHIKGNSDVFFFWAGNKRQLSNCLVVETMYRDHSIQCLKTYFLPVPIKVNNYIFTSSHSECHL